MSGGSTDARPRRGLRWTLGGIMILIALVAAPLAWYARQVRESARIRMEADARRAAVIAQINSQVKHIERLWVEKLAIEEKTRRDRAEARARLRGRLTDAPPAPTPADEEPPR